jgi:hypothetical protein
MSRTSSAKARGKGLYTQAKTPEDYLNQRLDKSGDCWEFTSGKDKYGYGQVHAARTAKDLGVTRAHQMAYVTWVGPIGDGLFVCHKCDNPSCCNPEHLFLGTPLENNQDMHNKGRNVSPKPERKLDYDLIINSHKKVDCMTLAESLGCSFGTICKIWRKHRLTGRNFYG